MQLFWYFALSRLVLGNYVEWVAQIGGDDQENAKQLTVDDQSGTVLAVGVARSVNMSIFDANSGVIPAYSYTKDATFDGYAANFYQNGTLNWYIRFAGGSYDDMNQAATDGQGHFAVVGLTMSRPCRAYNMKNDLILELTNSGQALKADGFLLLLDSFGSIAWFARLNGLLYENFWSVDMSPNGQIWVAGSTESNGSTIVDAFNVTQNLMNFTETLSSFVAKFDSNGSLLWFAQQMGVSSPFSVAWSESSSRVAISGRMSASSNMTVYDAAGAQVNSFIPPINQACFVIVYSNSGSYVWSITVEANAGGVCDDLVVSFDDDDNIWLTGFITAQSVIRQADGNVAKVLQYGMGDASFASKFNSAGVHQWTVQMYGQTEATGFTRFSFHDVSQGNDMLAVTAWTNGTNVPVYGIAGQILTTVQSSGGYDSVILNFYSNGTYVNQQRVQGAGDDRLTSVKFNSKNDMFVTGRFTSQNLVLADTDGSVCHNVTRFGPLQALVAKVNTGTRQGFCPASILLSTTITTTTTTTTISTSTLTTIIATTTTTTPTITTMPFGSVGMETTTGTWLTSSGITEIQSSAFTTQDGILGAQTLQSSSFPNTASFGSSQSEVLSASSLASNVTVLPLNTACSSGGVCLSQLASVAPSTTRAQTQQGSIIFSQNLRSQGGISLQISSSSIIDPAQDAKFARDIMQDLLPIIVGVLASLIVIAVIVAFCIVRRRRQKQKKLMFAMRVSQTTDMTSSYNVNQSSINTMNATTVVNTFQAISVPAYIQMREGANFRPVDNKVLQAGGQGAISVVDVLQFPSGHPLSFAGIRRGVAKRFGTDVLQETFLQEVALLWQFNHSEFIAKIFGYDNEAKVIIMKYYEMGSLQGWIHDQSKILTVDQVFSFALDVASAINLVHVNGVAHCDIKPANFLVYVENQNSSLGSNSDVMRVCLTDFGVCKVVDQTQIVQGMQWNSVTGRTLRYSAPELLQDYREFFRNNPHLIYAQDIYAAGILFNELITRQEPWYGLPADAVIENVLSGLRPPTPIQPESQAIVEYLNLIQSCWSQDPKSRPNTEQVCNGMKKILHP
ncbi:hypothetical protein MP228_002412 [Amoeboaphelidium protococcarum]|nr:hypothetical protein MP228_002412 [Amoeboaphelidium protococcarum]